MTSPRRQRVLVTGAAGFTGHHVVAAAAGAGFTVRATDLSSRHYGAMFDALGVEFVATDLGRGEGLDRLLDGVDGVFHVAGIHDYSTPLEILRAANVTAVENLCAASAAGGVPRFVHLSSVGVYGYDWHGRPVAEDAEKLTPPLNDYNVTKWQGEQIVHQYVRDRGLPATVLRPAAIYGPRSEYGLYRALRQVHDSRGKSHILMVGSGEHTEAFVHVEDVCRAMIHVHDHDETVGEAYNVADDSRLTTAQFFSLLSRALFGEEKPFRHIPLRLLLPVAVLSQRWARLRGTKPWLEPATLQYLSFDRIWENTKLKQTGFEYRYPNVEKGMAETVRWYRDNGWLR